MFAYKLITLYVLLHFISLIYSLNVYKSDSNHIKTSTYESQTYISDTVKRIKRAITTSQVLTFNITNALILLVFKGLLILAGILGKISFWKYPNLGGIPFARTFNSSSVQLNEDLVNQIYYSLFSNEDQRWSSAYMWSINKDDFGCLYRMACENRQSAQIYLYCGKFLNKIINFVFGALDVSYKRRYYENILNEIQEAMNSAEDECKVRYRCSAPFDGLNLISILKSLS